MWTFNLLEKELLPQLSGIVKALFIIRECEGTGVSTGLIEFKRAGLRENESPGFSNEFKMPFTKGTLRVGELIDWGFSVNGAASVLGATLIVLIAFTYGFTVALLAGALTYLAAFFLMSLKSRW